MFVYSIINMKDIYIRIGRIIEIFQYIEYNLPLALQYKKVLDLFSTNNVVPIKEFQKVEEDALELRQYLSKSTMGNLIYVVESANIFDKAQIKQLKNFLYFRNEIAHSFFKENHLLFSQKHDEIIDYLDKKIIEIGNVNNTICLMIQEFIKRYNELI